jgi:putative DNA primase/helicase
MSIPSEESTVDIQAYADYAMDIYKLGFNIMPMKLDEKAPVGAWKPYTHRRQTEQEIRSFSWGSNLAVINGVNNLRTIDIDGSEDADLLFNFMMLLGLDFEPDVYQWVVATPGGGFHLHFECPDDLTLTSAGWLVGDPLTEGAFKQIELRWSDCLTMFPPSIHPEAQKPYEWLFGTPAMPLKSIPGAVVEKAFLAIASVRKVEPAPPKKLPQVKPPKYDAWTEKALTQELGILRAAPDGSRNNQLNKSAFALGQIVGAGLLTEADVEQELTEVALTIGLGEKETAATIKSGLDAGKLKPRMPKQIYRENEPAFELAPTKKFNKGYHEWLARFSPDDQGHADAIHELYGPYLAFNNSLGWLIWNGTHFTTSVQRINTLIVHILRERHKAAVHMEHALLIKNSQAMAGRVAAVRSLLENLCVVEVDEFDAEPDLINCLSGIVNLRTKKLLPHDPKYRFTWCSPVAYNPAADGSLWLDFLRATVETDDMVEYLQEALGYSITGHTSEESLFYVFGPPRAGKGSMSETLLAILPRPIAVEVDFNTFTAKREGDAQNFDLAPMKAARLVFASESNKYQSLNPAKVKALTGGNLVYCAFKYGQHFSYKPQYAVWLSSNHELNADAEDDALWGRVKVIGFPYSRLGQEDKSLKLRLQSRENLEAVLSWLIDGAYLWYQHGGRGLQTPEAVKELTNAQRAAQDVVSIWLDECCDKIAGEWTEHSKLLASYQAWCNSNGHKPKEGNGFSRSLNRQPGVQSERKGGGGIRGVSGLRLKETSF